LAGDNQPELYRSLVQACRFCGLYEASVAAHERAQALDPHIVTSVGNTYLHMGDYENCLRTLRKNPLYGDAFAFIRQGRDVEALRVLREREKSEIPEMLRLMVTSLRALLEGKREESIEAAERFNASLFDPEGIFLATRHIAYFGEVEPALNDLRQSLDGGYLFYRLLDDPWFDPLRSHPGFAEIAERVESRYREAISAFKQADGERLLGVRL
jgi:hypothetical protein